MKLHLPKGIKSALLACVCATAALSPTLTSGALAGGVFLATIAGQAMAEEVSLTGTIRKDITGDTSINVIINSENASQATPQGLTFNDLDSGGATTSDVTMTGDLSIGASGGRVIVWTGMGTIDGAVKLGGELYVGLSEWSGGTLKLVGVVSGTGGITVDRTISTYNRGEGSLILDGIYAASGSITMSENGRLELGEDFAYAGTMVKGETSTEGDVTTTVYTKSSFIDSSVSTFSVEGDGATVTTANSPRWSIASDGTLTLTSYHHTYDSVTGVVWGGASNTLSGFEQGDTVTFTGSSDVSLGADVYSASVTVDSGATLSLSDKNGAGHVLYVNTLSNSGTLTLGVNVSTNVYDASAAGAYTIAAGNTLTVNGIENGNAGRIWNLVTKLTSEKDESGANAGQLVINGNFNASTGDYKGEKHTITGSVKVNGQMEVNSWSGSNTDQATVIAAGGRLEVTGNTTFLSKQTLDVQGELVVGGKLFLGHWSSGVDPYGHLNISGANAKVTVNGLYFNDAFKHETEEKYTSGVWLKDGASLIIGSDGIAAELNKTPVISLADGTLGATADWEGKLSMTLGGALKIADSGYTITLGDPGTTTTFTGTVTNNGMLVLKGALAVESDAALTQSTEYAYTDTASNGFGTIRHYFVQYGTEGDGTKSLDVSGATYNSNAVSTDTLGAYYTTNGTTYYVNKNESVSGTITGAKALVIAAGVELKYTDASEQNLESISLAGGSTLNLEKTSTKSDTQVVLGGGTGVNHTIKGTNTSVRTDVSGTGNLTLMNTGDGVTNSEVFYLKGDVDNTGTVTIEGPVRVTKDDDGTDVGKLTLSHTAINNGSLTIDSASENLALANGATLDSLGSAASGVYSDGVNGYIGTATFLIKEGSGEGTKYLSVGGSTSSFVLGDTTYTISGGNAYSGFTRLNSTAENYGTYYINSDATYGEAMSAATSLYVTSGKELTITTDVSSTVQGITLSNGGKLLVGKNNPGKTIILAGGNNTVERQTGDSSGITLNAQGSGNLTFLNSRNGAAWVSGTLEQNGNLTLKSYNPNTEAAGGSIDLQSGASINNTGTVTLESGQFNMLGGSTIGTNVTGVSVNAGTMEVRSSAAVNLTNGSLAVAGGTLDVQSGSSVSAKGLSMSSGSTKLGVGITLTGGVTDATGAAVNTLVLTGGTLSASTDVTLGYDATLGAVTLGGVSGYTGGITIGSTGKTLTFTNTATNDGTLTLAGTIALGTGATSTLDKLTTADDEWYSDGENGFAGTRYTLVQQGTGTEVSSKSVDITGATLDSSLTGKLSSSGGNVYYMEVGTTYYVNASTGYDSGKMAGAEQIVVQGEGVSFGVSSGSVPTQSILVQDKATLALSGGTVSADVTLYNGKVTIAEGNFLESSDETNGIKLMSESAKNLSNNTIASGWNTGLAADVTGIGNLTLEGGSSSSGLIVRNSTLSFEGDLTLAKGEGGLISLESTAKLSNDGDVVVDSGVKVTADAEIANTGNVTVSSGASLVLNGKLNNSGNVQVDGGTLDLNVKPDEGKEIIVSNAGKLEVNEHTLNNLTLKGGTVSIDNYKTLTSTADAGIVLANTADGKTSSNVIESGGYTGLAANVTGTGNLTVTGGTAGDSSNGAELRKAFSFTGDLTLSKGSASDSANIRLNSGAVINNKGDVTIDTATVTMKSGSYLGTDANAAEAAVESVLVGAEGKLTLESGVTFQAGTLLVEGTLEFILNGSAQSLLSVDSFALGNEATLVLAEALDFSTKAALSLNYDSGNMATVDVDGISALAGTEFTTIDVSSWSSEDKQSLIDGDMALFNNVSAWDSGSTQTVYLNFGTDNSSNGEYELTWSNNQILVNASPGTTGAIPEPTTATLSLLALAALAARRRRK